MYCGTNKTALTSQKQIADALLALLKERAFGSITVSLLCREAGVSRQTFYSLFDSKEDVISYSLQMLCSEPEEAHTGHGEAASFCLHRLCRKFSIYVLDHADVLRVLFANDLTYLMQEIFSVTFVNCPSKKLEGDRSGTYAADFLSCALTGIAACYIRQGETLTAAEIEDITYSLLSGDRLRSL